jgi:hypothetical protein
MDGAEVLQSLFPSLIVNVFDFFVIDVIDPVFALFKRHRFEIDHEEHAILLEADDDFHVLFGIVLAGPPLEPAQGCLVEELVSTGSNGRTPTYTY